MQLIDTHAHIYEVEFQDNLSDILENAQKNYVQKIYMPNINETTLSKMMAVAARYPTQCFPMMGIHPCYIKRNFTNQLYLVEEWLNKASFLAIGEIGIDQYHSSAFLAEQEEAFMIQLNLAKKHQLPVSIHCRNAFKRMLQLLEKAQDGSLKGVIHCFTGNTIEAEYCIKLGFRLGIGGLITLPSHKLAETLTTIAANHLVLETDSPYLAPLPHRGKRNEPGYLRYTAAKLAAIKQMPLTEIAAITTENATRLFNNQ
ncbi:TatD family hydrolase [Candidatus Cardinium hertigii]|uniref:D-aminoacyl-tRNA deacylase n=1 Tax=Candidatus Cardinium hertigii TaxID=247481 RepID=A0A2Z3LAC3_9BACT|nr:TatD family hydrolase [Candidatus Cardinium hertigii]AWN82267.1 D-aminoacyl-tRNA deacylase [Candidatus Cardinium hertigii]